MKSIVKTLFTLVLLGSTLIYLPAHAETVEDPSSTAEQTITPGDEWSGEIPEPPAETIKEPAVPTDPQTPEQPVQTVTPESPTTPTTPNIVYQKPAVSVTPTQSDESTQTNIESSEATEAPTETEITIEAEKSLPTDSQESTVQVPETSHPHTAHKIRLMSITTTGIVVFTAIFVWAIVRLIKIDQAEKIYQAAVDRSIKVRDAKITRAEIASPNNRQKPNSKKPNSKNSKEN